jgi:hypothetical protein
VVVERRFMVAVGRKVADRVAAKRIYPIQVDPTRRSGLLQSRCLLLNLTFLMELVLLNAINTRL